ncbi:hypothetical protein D9M68_489020 [compost metagenome]
MLSRPVELHLECQRPLVPVCICVSGKAHQLLAGNTQFEAESSAVLQIAFDSHFDRVVSGAHIAPPGHGIATADKWTMSTFV